MANRANRTKALQVLLSPREMAYVLKYAEEEGLTLSSYGRRIVRAHLLEKIQGGKDAGRTGANGNGAGSDETSG